MSNPSATQISLGEARLAVRGTLTPEFSAFIGERQLTEWTRDKALVIAFVRGYNASLDDVFHALTKQEAKPADTAVPLALTG